MTENKSENIILSIAYAPPIEYFHFISVATNCLIEANENYQKQSFRNRCHIISAQGIQTLHIPIEHSKNNFIKDIKISYQENWQRQHWRSINTCYRSAPYYLFYDYLFEILYTKKEKYLFDFNLNLMNIFCQILKLETPLHTKDWINSEEIDLRKTLQPKNQNIRVTNNYYSSIFSISPEKRTFLSIYDLIFMEGPASLAILKSINVEFL